MTLSRGPYSELDKMSLFQDLKLKRRKVDSRCSSDGESIADTSTSSPDLLQPLSPKMCDQQQSAGQLELDDPTELEDGSPAPTAAANHHHHLQHPPSHHHLHHHHHHPHSNNMENNNTLTSNNNNNDCLTSPKLEHDGSRMMKDDDGDSERASPDSPGLLIDERPPSRLKPSDPGGCTPGALPNSSNCGGGASVIRSVADERPRSSSPPNSHNLALMNSIQLLQQHYSATGNAGSSSSSGSSVGAVHSVPGHQQQQHVTVLVTPSRMKPDQPTTLVTLGMRKQAPPSINLANTSNNANSSSTSSSSNCNGSNSNVGSNKNEEPNRLTSTPQSSTSSSPSSSSSSSNSSSNSSSTSAVSPNQANQQPVHLQMFQQPPVGGMSKFSSSQSLSNNSNIQQQQQHLAQQQMLQAMQQQIRIKKERMPQYTIVNQNPNMSMMPGSQLRQQNIHMIPNPQQQLYVKRERSLPGQSHTIVNMPPVSMAGPANHQRQPSSSPVQVCNSTSPMQPPMSPSQQHQNRQQSPVHMGSTNMGQSPHIIIKRERHAPNQSMKNVMQLSPNNQRLPSPIQVSPTTSPLNPAMQIRHPMRDAAILFRVKNEAQVPNLMQQQPPGMAHRITVWPGGQQRINGVKPEVIGGPLPPLRSQMSPQQSPQHHQSPSPIASQTPPRNTPTVIMGESCGVRTMVWSYDSPPQVQTTTPPIAPSSATNTTVGSQGIMTLSRGPYSELDKMSLFQDLKLKRRKVDSRCSSDGESIADTSTSSPDLLQPLSPKMCDQQQSAGQLELDDPTELEDGSPAPTAAANHHHHLQHPPSHHHLHHHHHHPHSNNMENNNTLTSNNNNNDCLTSPKLEHDGSRMMKDDDGDSERASPDSPGLLIDERPPSRLKPSDPGGCTPGALPNSSNCGGGASVIRSVADERPRSSSPPNSHNLALMNSIQLLQQHYSASGNAGSSSSSGSSVGAVHSVPGHQQQQHVTVLVTPSRMKPDQPTTLVTLGMRKQAPPSINLANTSNNTNSSSTSSSSNCNGSNSNVGSNKNEEPNRLTSTPQSSTSSSPSSSSSSSNSSSNSSSTSAVSPNQANQQPVHLQMFQQPPVGGMSKFSSSQSLSNNSNIQQQQQHLAQQQMLQAMQQQIRIKKERMPQYTIVNQNPNMSMMPGSQLRQQNIHMIPNPQQQLYVKRERSLPGQSHTIVNMPPVSMAGPANHQRQPSSSPVQVCNSTSPMQPPMSPSQQHQNRQQSPVHMGSTNMGQSPHIIIKRERHAPNQSMKNVMQLSPNNQRLPSPIQVSPTTSPLNPAMQIRHPMRDAAILFRVKNEAQVPNLMQQQPPGMAHRITVWPGGQQRINGVKPEVIGGPLPPLRSQMSPQQSPQHHQSPSPIASQTPPRNTPTVIMGESCGVRTMVWSYDSPPQVQTTTPPIAPSSATNTTVGSQGPLGPGSSLGMGTIPPSPGNHHHQNSNSSSSSSSTNNNEEAAHLLLSLGQTVRQNEVNFFYSGALRPINTC
ncbi:hypothetical protein RP20_CCG004877 [Aedes albopictus]|nr:hypothetical protein RP20_CCG004877 [Aedes albopictus]